MQKCKEAKKEQKYKENSRLNTFKSRSIKSEISQMINSLNYHRRRKIKATSQDEILKKWKEHFYNKRGKTTKIPDEPTEINHGQVDIKLGHFTEDELDTVQETIERRKKQQNLIE